MIRISPDIMGGALRPKARRHVALLAPLLVACAAPSPGGGRRTAPPASATRPDPGSGAAPGGASNTPSRAASGRPAAHLALSPGDVARLPSRFGTLIVFDDGAYRCLAFNKRLVVQSCRSRGDPLDFRYEYVAMMLAGAFVRMGAPTRVRSARGAHPAPRRPARRAVVLGLGGAALPTLLTRNWPALRVDTVEIDPAVIRAAGRWFGYRTRAGETAYLQDAAAFARRPDRKGRYDLVLVDCYGAKFIPAHLQTRAFLASLGNLLAPGGLIVANVWQTHPRYPTIVARYAGIFPWVWTLPGKRSGNAMVLASRRPLVKSPGLWAARARRAAPSLRPRLDLSSHLLRLHRVAPSRAR